MKKAITDQSQITSLTCSGNDILQQVACLTTLLNNLNSILTYNNAILNGKYPTTGSYANQNYLNSIVNQCVTNTSNNTIGGNYNGAGDFIATNPFLIRSYTDPITDAIGKCQPIYQQIVAQQNANIAAMAVANSNVAFVNSNITAIQTQLTTLQNSPEYAQAQADAATISKAKIIVIVVVSVVVVGIIGYFWFKKKNS